ncbi:MAG: type I 3-dehydroquinate dehydratase, partial [Methanobacteriota archaeon]
MRVCIPITANNVSDAIEDIKKAQQKADLLELRIDFIDNIDVNGVEEMLAATSKPAIVTCRKAGEGGKWKGT